jgi:hypothetical protein
MKKPHGVENALNAPSCLVSPKPKVKQKAKQTTTTTTMPII